MAEQLRADAGIAAKLGAAVADIAVDRRADFRVAEIQLRRGQGRARAGQGGVRLVFLRVDHGELRLRRGQSRLGFLAAGQRLWKVLLAVCASCTEPALVAARVR